MSLHVMNPSSRVPVEYSFYAVQQNGAQALSESTLFTMLIWSVSPRQSIIYTLKINSSVSWNITNLYSLTHLHALIVSTTTDDKLLRNKIGQAMLERIKRAHKNGEKFKIFILIPLIPAFEGDLATSEASSAR